MSLLEINDLYTYFDTRQGLIKAVNGVSLRIDAGKTLAVVGESGSGKSQTAMSILKLFDKNQRIHSGEILFDGKIISNNDNHAMRDIRGNSISMIFQEPMNSLNPVFKISHQIAEVLMLHQKQNKTEALNNAVELLRMVKIAHPENIASRYPHELSGGMRQRVMIAIALACKPKLLIADEPTTALDVTIQAQILHLIRELQRKDNTAVMFITHDLGVVNQIADDVAVMYCGQVVELAPASHIFNPTSPYVHPYTKALLNSHPAYANTNARRLETIEGTVPHPLDLPIGCKFALRCKFATEDCHKIEPPLEAISDVHHIRCFHPQIARSTHE